MGLEEANGVDVKKSALFLGGVSVLENFSALIWFLFVLTQKIVSMKFVP